MSRNDEFSIGEYYHLYNRGVDKRIIFSTKSDYRRFQYLLLLCNNIKPLSYKDMLKVDGELLANNGESKDVLVSVGAYCLMPNHFHILVKEVCEGGISKFMHKLSTAYIMYFNTRNERSGRLFESTFKTKHLNSDEYLKYIFSYIHLNPVKLVGPTWKEKGITNLPGAKKFLDSYEFSSYLDYQDTKRQLSSILSSNDFPKYFSSKQEFDDIVNSWLNFPRLSLGKN